MLPFVDTGSEILLKNRNFGRKDWLYLLSGGIFSFIFASVLMTGWPEGLLPNLKYPFSYQSDGLWFLWNIQRIAEGGWFSAFRNGYPFNVSFLDFPGSDMGISVVYGIISCFFDTPTEIFNIFFLLGFVVVFIASFVVSRIIGLNTIFALAASLIFNFLPFHFLRLVHLPYTWYFVVPLFYCLGLYIFCLSADGFHEISLLKLSLLHLGCFFLASFIIYNVLFGGIILGVSGIMGSLKSRRMLNLLLSASLILAVSLGVLANISPHLKYRFDFGPNAELAKRSAAESEYYALKMTHLLLPRRYHRLSSLAEKTERYIATSPLNTENTSSSLGIIGVMGFVLAFLLMLSRFSNRNIEDRLLFFIGILLVLFLFSTIGGLGSVFALLISPLIRGWSRISVFIAYGAIIVFFLALQLRIEKSKNMSINQKKPLFAVLAFMMICVGLYDQTVPANRTYNEKTRIHFENDRKFIKRIEDCLPRGSAIYQLPYLPFPEVPPLHQLAAYDLVKGCLHSRELRWSYGGTKAREGDYFYRALAAQPMEKQIEIIQRLGFAGIYLDRRGYADNGSEVVGHISEILGEPPMIEQENGALVFFRLPLPFHATDYSQMSAREIMRIAGFFADMYGVRYESTLSEGTDFSRSGLPLFLRDAEGLSGEEPWGRWSDADVAPSVLFEFLESLPNRFSLELEANAFGPNIGKDLTVKVGSKAYAAHIPEGHFSAALDVELGGESAQTIEFIPPAPTSPKELGMSEDGRKLGIGFIRMRIIEPEADKDEPRYESSLSEGADFSRSGLPLFLRNAEGLSGEEPWGRWSDADVSPSVRFEFFEPLPDRFSMELETNAFGPNIGKDLTVKVGSKAYAVHIPEGHFSAALDVELGGEKAQTIEFFPPAPTSPKELGLSEDGRKLGIGFIGMRIKELQ